jgi:hypothetical protein
MLVRIVPVVQNGFALLLVPSRDGDADTSSPGTEPQPPAGAAREQRPGPPPRNVSSDLVRAELLASREGLQEDLRDAMLREREARNDVDALRDALATIERLFADDATG